MVEVLKHNGPSECGEDSNHIFFVCPAARFLWACFREVAGGRWCHTNLPDMFREVLEPIHAAGRPALWVAIGALLWTLWNIHNKLVVDHVIPLRATDAMYKLCGFLQLWQPLSRHHDRDSIDRIPSALRTTPRSLAPLVPPPPTETD